jgi:uncharacterized protein (TIGR02145 family)/uncharacterized repeat protein (TIGR02543 family)
MKMQLMMRNNKQETQYKMKNIAKQILVFTMMILGATGAWAQITPERQSDGSWRFTMPSGNRLLNVEWKAEAELAWQLGGQPVPQEGVSGYVGFEDHVTFPTLSNPHGLPVTYSSTNTNAATIDATTGAITFVGAGTTTIKAAFAGNNDYAPDTVSYTLTVEDSYTLTLAVNNSAMGAVSLVDTPDHVIPITTTAGTFKVIPGTNVNVTATPAEHHYMQKWNNEAALNSNVAVNTTFTVTKDTTLTAYFVHKPILTLKSNPSSGNAGHVDVDSVNHALPAGVVASNDTVYKYIVDYDTTVTVKAIPAPHYHLASWNNTGGNDLQQEVTITQDMEITGVFAIDTFTLTLKTNDINKGTVEVTNHLGNPDIVSHDPDANGTRTYKVNYGAEVIIKATANVNSHYHLASWSNGATVNTEDTIHVIETGDSIIMANFGPNTYHVTLNTNGGTINSGDVSSYTYGEGANLPTDISRTGHTFDGWYTNANLTGDAVTSIPATAIGDTAFWAKWNINSYTIAASANPTEGGTVTGAGSYEYSANVTLTAAYNPGYHFVNWIEADTVYSTNASITVQATGNRTLTAQFELSSYDVTTSVANTADVRGTVQINYTDVDGQSQITATGATAQATAQNGSTSTLTATPATGYHFVKWQNANGTQVSTENPLSVTSAVDTAFTAVFAPDTFTITYMDGDVELNVDTFYYRQPITEYTSSKTGWDFISWSPEVPVLMPAENLTVYAQWYRICDSIQDQDGNKYASVNIGNKCWMAANMRATHYADGRAIPNVYEYQSTLYPNVTENVNLAGRLYDWYAAMDVEKPTKAASIQGICPNDWRMPTAEDAALLNAVPATELRTTTGWVSPNYNTNSTGFSAYPAGFYNSTLGRFEGMGTETDWWMVNDASVYGTTSAGGTTSSIQIPYYCDTYLIVTRDPKDAISVRCVKD